MKVIYSKVRLTRHQYDEIKDRFPEWLVDSYRNVKNYRKVTTEMYEVVEEYGKGRSKKPLNFDGYLHKKFSRVAFFIDNYNINKSYQHELERALYSIIKWRINYDRCVKVIYNHLLTLQRQHANRKEIEDILDNTEYEKYVLACENINGLYKKINRIRGRRYTLNKDEKMIIKIIKELEKINYVGSLVDIDEVTWEDVENARNIPEKKRISDMCTPELMNRLKKEIEIIENRNKIENRNRIMRRKY